MGQADPVPVVAVRQAAQQVISAYVLNVEPRDRLLVIGECAREHGTEVAVALYEFIVLHYLDALEQHDPVTELGRFLYTLGDLVERVAAEGDQPATDVVLPLILSDLVGDAEEDLGERGDAVRRAVRAAQAALAAHWLVRGGIEPLGLLQALDLEDMRVVTRVVATLGEVLLDAADVVWGLSCEQIISVLMPTVDQVLEQVAAEQEVPVAEVVVTYWHQLALADNNLHGRVQD